MAGGSRDDTRIRRFAAFDLWNFRVYVAGQLVSTMGTWMQTLGQTWLVLVLTDRTDQLGITVALQWLPLLLLGAFTGVLADRFDNRRLLIGTSVAAGALAFGLGVLVATDHTTIWWLYGFALALGLVNAVERPAMQTILFQLIGPDRLPSGIAVNQMVNVAGRMVGPAVAGVLIATAGISACFFVNAASYLVVIAALLLIKGDEMIPRPRLAKTAGQLREGLRYVRHTPAVRRPLVVMAIVGTVAYNFQTTIPALVKYSFHLGAGSVGAVLSISGIGSVVGGLVVAGIRPHPVNTLAAGLFGLAVTVALYGIAPTFAWLLVVSIGLGAASSMFLTIDATVVQQAADPAMLGRVMALHQIAWQGTTPIGALIIGWLIEATSPRVPFILAAVTAGVCGVAVAVGGRRTETLATAPVGGGG
jgi:MFS family permease